MDVKIISTGSQGNAVLLNGSILIDCGVPLKKLEDVKKDLKLVLLTHIHSDHFNKSTVRALASERPTLRWCCCSWMVEPLVKSKVDKRRIDVLKPGLTYAYPSLVDIAPVDLVHDVPNCGWHLKFPYDSGERVFYATDTGTLNHVSAPNYDLYLVEANHKREEIENKIHEKEKAGEFSYERRAVRTHLSEEQTLDWLAENMGPNSSYIFLHQHRERI